VRAGLQELLTVPAEELVLTLSLEVSPQLAVALEVTVQLVVLEVLAVALGTERRLVVLERLAKDLLEEIHQEQATPYIPAAVAVAVALLVAR
jgi:hypothetical protein